MHPHISKYCSTLFYEGKLLDAPDLEKLRTAKWHSPKLPPFSIFSVQGRETERNHSFQNDKEVSVVGKLLHQLISTAEKGTVRFSSGNRIFQQIDRPNDILPIVDWTDRNHNSLQSSDAIFAKLCATKLCCGANILLDRGWISRSGEICDNLIDSANLYSWILQGSSSNECSPNTKPVQLVDSE